MRDIYTTQLIIAPAHHDRLLDTAERTGRSLENIMAQYVEEYDGVAEQNKLLLDALKTVVALAEETHKSWDADEDMRVGKILIALAGKNDGYRSDIDWIHELIKQCEGNKNG